MNPDALVDAPKKSPAAEFFEDCVMIMLTEDVQERYTDPINAMTELVNKGAGALGRE